MHVVLLGDSIFDNVAYVRGGPDVVVQLRERLPQGARATLLAVDGAVARSVFAQLDRVPRDATHLVLSVGGNDALALMGLLTQPTRFGAEAFDRLAVAVDRFEQDYQLVVQAVARLSKCTFICTVYNGNLDHELQRPARAALAVFNDAIQRVARESSMQVIELRGVCTEHGDYANPIEPSVQGGGKIAAAIAAAIRLEATPTTDGEEEHATH